MIRCDECQHREAGGRYRVTIVALDYIEESQRDAGNWSESNLCAHCMRQHVYSPVKVERLGPPEDEPPTSGKAA